MPDAGLSAHRHRSGFRSILSQAGHAGRLHAASLAACRSSAIRLQMPLCLRAQTKLTSLRMSARLQSFFRVEGFEDGSREAGLLWPARMRP